MSSVKWWYCRHKKTASSDDAWTTSDSSRCVIKPATCWHPAATDANNNLHQPCLNYEYKYILTCRLTTATSQKIPRKNNSVHAWIKLIICYYYYHYFWPLVLCSRESLKLTQRRVRSSVHAVSGRQTVMQQNSIKALHQNRNPLKSLFTLLYYAIFQCMAGQMTLLHRLFTTHLSCSSGNLHYIT